MDVRDLKQEEVQLLHGLFAKRGEFLLAHPNPAIGFDRLTDQGFVECRHVAADADLFSLTPAGYQALQSRRKDVPVRDPQDWPDRLLCRCSHGSQNFHDEQGVYRCTHCQAEFSLTADGRRLHWSVNGEPKWILSHAAAWIRCGVDAKPIRFGFSADDRTSV